MVDKIKPFKMENASGGGTETDLTPTEADPLEDYVACKGLALENSDNLRLEKVGSSVGYYDLASGQKTLKSLKCLDLSFAGDLRAYLRVNTASYTVAASFLFRGTNELATPSSVRVIVSVSAGGVTGNIRLYDVTNAQILGTELINQTTPTIVTISTANWSAGPSVVEIQMQRTAGGGSAEVRVHALSLEW